MGGKVVGSNPATPTKAGQRCPAFFNPYPVMYTVYILYSFVKAKYYAGQTNNIEARLNRHNQGRTLSTKHGIPWKLIYTFNFETRSEAVFLETKIRNRGINRVC